MKTIIIISWLIIIYRFIDAFSWQTVHQNNKEINQSATPTFFKSMGQTKPNRGNVPRKKQKQNQKERK